MNVCESDNIFPWFQFFSRSCSYLFSRTCSLDSQFHKFLFQSGQVMKSRGANTMPDVRGQEAMWPLAMRQSDHRVTLSTNCNVALSLKACHMSYVTLSNVTCSNRSWGDLTSSSHCLLLGPLDNVALSHIACHIYHMLDCHRSHMSQVKLSHSQLWLRIMSHCHILHLSLVTNAESHEAMWHAMRLGHQVMAPWGRKIRGWYHRSLALRPCLGWPQNIEAIIKLHCALCNNAYCISGSHLSSASQPWWLALIERILLLFCPIHKTLSHDNVNWHANDVLPSSMNWQTAFPRRGER